MNRIYKVQIMVNKPDAMNNIDTISLIKTDSPVSFEKYVVLYNQYDYLIETPFYAFGGLGN